MSDHRDTPRGPTSQELRRRALAHVEWTMPPGLEHVRYEEWERSVCSCHGGYPKCTRCHALSYLNARVEDWKPPTDATDGYATGLSVADADSWRRRWDAVPWPP